MTPKKSKTHFIKVRVSPQEKEIIQHKADEQGLSISDFLRQTTLQYRLRNNAKQKEALRNLARIASNLNQIARQVNTYKVDIDKIQLLTSLCLIEEQTKEIQICI